MSYFDQLIRISEESGLAVKVVYDPERDNFDKWYATCTNREGTYYAYHATLEKACHKLLTEMEII